jgi:hypothetical protein
MSWSWGATALVSWPRSTSSQNFRTCACRFCVIPLKMIFPSRGGRRHRNSSAIFMEISACRRPLSSVQSGRCGHWEHGTNGGRANSSITPMNFRSTRNTRCSVVKAASMSVIPASLSNRSGPLQRGSATGESLVGALMVRRKSSRGSLAITSSANRC